MPAPDPSAMSAVAFRAIREDLGLSQMDLGQRLRTPVVQRTVRRWESGQFPIPRSVQDQVLCWQRQKRAAVTALIDDLRRRHGPDPTGVVIDVSAGGVVHQITGARRWGDRWLRNVALQAAAVYPAVLVGDPSDDPGDVPSGRPDTEGHR